ncbi:MAG: acyl-CoA dehydratase activase-related protein [Verrucomicrobiales bacterium]|nr:acyl-CoA dehydratase activase-related protein [Verrucomicrobiales bacterium]
MTDGFVTPDLSDPGVCYLGLDVGTETIKVVELIRGAGNLRVGHREIIGHGKKPGQTLLESLPRWNWSEIKAAAVTGRFSTQINLPRVPAKQALLRGYRFLFGDKPATIVNIGSHGFSVLELRANGLTVFRENGRCSQGTGNFLRQLVERFSLTVEEASVLCADVPNPAPLSGRCPVILKTDMTHLANKGESRERILAGLFDAVCENVSVLIKPGVSPSRVLLTGGVSRSPRVRRIFGELLAKQGMTLVAADEEQLLCMEALGCAIIAAENPTALPVPDKLLLPPRELKLERLPALADSLHRVRRMSKQPWARVNGVFRRLVIGFDIGSTGSKAVALDLTTQETVWEAYRQTLGDPVGAAQDLLRRFTEHPAMKYPVVAFGTTGSGREVSGSLLTSCYGKDAVFIVNEIVAHATGALHYDPRVDTIFEIGGQDAKYTRLAEGRIIDCAMNEACSAGTGSFIEEQGRKFSGIEDVCQLGLAAQAAPSGVSLGQHCSVFMAEVIDEAVGAGVGQPAIISGLYDSIIKNYLNRVKGNRSVGKVIFCQGMPFSAAALAAAVARQTGSEVIVPPNPGTVGAMGIAMLAARELDAARLAPLDLARFLDAKVEQKDTFVCGSNRGCGGAGNHCRIERLRTLVADQHSNFTWGGGCSLYDKGTRKKKLPDLAPDPFRERDERLQKLLAPLVAPRGGPRIAMSDEFMAKGLFPFFAAYFHAAGFDLEIVTGAGPDVLKRGIQSANAPFCAPMQLFHGVAQRLAASGADWMFVPMIRSLPGETGQRCAVGCPIIQGAPKVVEQGLASEKGRVPRMLTPIINFGPGNLESKEFLKSCAQLAKELGLEEPQGRAVWSAGQAAQREFDAGCQESGRRALEFCRAQKLVPVVVLGRNYTIYNKVLNSNVPAILREQGAIGIPVDCFPLAAETPLFNDMFWGYGQTILRAAHQVRRMPGVYALYCSNYSCGPDSFNLHFAAYAMGGKPFVVIETDGHSGDAGTRTRVEAFLHCVEEDRRAKPDDAALNDFQSVQFSGLRLSDIQQRNGKSETLLVPYIGPASESVTAVFRGLGFKAESLSAPDADSLRLGRRHTSGKECLPMPLTLGTLIQHLERAPAEEKFVLLMPCSDGPCRFGVYNLLNNIVLDRLGWRDRVRICSPKDTGYFDDLPPGTEMLVFAALAACDLLLQAKFDVRPVERIPGETEKLYQRAHGELLAQVGAAARGNLSLGPALWQVASGRLFGLRALLERAAREFARLRGPGDLPCVELTGEIYVRGVEFANDSVIEKLEARGLRVHLAPKTEWINYCGQVQRQTEGRNRLSDAFSHRVQRRIEGAALAAMAPHLGWSPLPATTEAFAAAEPYVHSALWGEAVLTVGTPLHEYRHGHIDAVLSVGPLECMPTKIAEAQWHHVAEHEGVLCLTLGFNGDAVNSAALDNFAFEVKERFKARKPPAHFDLNVQRNEQPFAANDMAKDGLCPFSDAGECIPADAAGKTAVLQTGEI